MNSTITCPKCQNEFEITEVIRSQLTAQIRGELDVEAAKRQAELDAAKKELDQERAAVQPSCMTKTPWLWSDTS